MHCFSLLAFVPSFFLFLTSFTFFLFSLSSSLSLTKQVRCVRWNPNPSRSSVAVCVGKVVLLLKIGMSTKSTLQATDAWMETVVGGVTTEEDEDDSSAAGKKSDDMDEDDDDDDKEEEDEDEDEDKKKKKTKNRSKTSSTTKWRRWTSSSPSVNRVMVEGAILTLDDWIHTKEIVWHSKGDYFATVADAGSKKNVAMVHQVSKTTSAALFRKVDKIQSVEFHPNKPFIFLATQTHVRVYSLAQPVKLKKKLSSSAKWMSSIVVHPSGDHLLTGTYDKRKFFFSQCLFLFLCLFCFIH